MLCVFSGVCKQVHDDLFESSPIRAHRDRFLRQRDCKVVPALVDLMANSLNRALHHITDGDVIDIEFNPASANPRQVQVVSLALQ